MPLRIGIDTGGTFTDVVAFDTDRGRSTFLKLPCTPDDPGREVVRGVVEATEQTGIGAEAIDLIVHGTTVATDVVLQRAGARIAMITTAGFANLLHIQRQNRPRLYDTRTRRSSPLRRNLRGWPGRIPRHRRSGRDSHAPDQHAQHAGGSDRAHLPDSGHPLRPDPRQRRSRPHARRLWCCSRAGMSGRPHPRGNRRRSAQVTPWGLEGGQPARGGHCTLTSPKGEARLLPTKLFTTLAKGDRLRIETPGGGGWGRTK